MIHVENLSLQLGGFRLSNVSFDVPQAGYGVLMGRTGIGKTTILEAICGLRTLTAGRIVLHGRDVTRLPPGQRGLGYVPQDGGLFSTMSVWDHLAFAPTVHRWSAADVENRVRELAASLGIAHLLERWPQGLSGGEKQRIALGRALACRPGVLLLDEPLSALDEETREQMYTLLGSLPRQTGVTILHVTHSRREAQVLADRVLVLSDGVVREANPADLTNVVNGDGSPVPPAAAPLENPDRNPA